jgi:hypothetical protein
MGADVWLLGRAARALLALQTALRANFSGWTGDNPCTGQWTGVMCAADSRVTSVYAPACFCCAATVGSEFCMRVYCARLPV